MAALGRTAQSAWTLHRGVCAVAPCLLKHTWPPRAPVGAWSRTGLSRMQSGPSGCECAPMRPPRAPPRPGACGPGLARKQGLCRCGEGRVTPSPVTGAPKKGNSDTGTGGHCSTRQQRQRLGSAAPSQGHRGPQPGWELGQRRGQVSLALLTPDASPRCPGLGGKIQRRL